MGPLRYLALLGWLWSSLVYSADAVQGQVTPQWAEQYLSMNYPDLLASSHQDHVVSYYYFGQWQQFTLIGLERVRGSDYRQQLTLLVFKQQSLLGYFADVASFPSKLTDGGELVFPPGLEPEQIVRLTDLPQQICLPRLSHCASWHAAAAADAAASLDPAAVDHGPHLDADAAGSATAEQCVDCSAN